VIHSGDTLAMRIPHYIIKNHNGIYYFRYVIPEHLRHKFPNNRREIRRTLHTRSKHEAVKKAKFYWVAIMTKNTLDIDIDFESQARAEEVMLGRGAYLDSELTKLKQAYEETFDPEPMSIFTGNLNSHDVDCLNLLVAHRSTNHNKSNTTITEVPLSIPDNRKEIVKIVAEFLDEKKGAITAKTFDDYNYQLRLFQRVSSIQFTDEINIDSIREYKTKIQKLPARLEQKKETKGKSVDEILRLSLPPMASQTLKKNVTCVAEFLKWLYHQKIISDDLSSILGGIKNNIAKKQNELTDVFDNTDLSKMFSVDEYQIDGFKGYSFRYWLPLLALYTGARSNELCQLYVEDIVLIDEIYTLRIDDIPDDKQLKNSQSKRTIPIHQKLIELGFLDYVDVMKQRNEKYLFPTLTADKYGYRTKNISRFFNSAYKSHNGFLAMCNIQGSQSKGRKVFHSFRHTFINQAKQLELEEHIIKQLVGHSSDNITMNRYGKDYGLPILKKNIDKIKFDIKHPKKWAKRFM
jgi:integrase